ncbi:kinase-like domain-containing protein [Suillus subluteus]|nr:kinase-like domain-containing protein [Suillus subluteus]
MNPKLPIRVDGRFRLGEVLGSGSYTVVYHAMNIINNDAVAIKLESITTQPSSVQRKYTILKRLEGGVGIPCALWFGRESQYHALVLGLLGPSLHNLFLTHDRKFSLHTVVNLGIQLISRLEYIHSHNYVHCNIIPQNVMVGLGHLKHTAFIIDFGIAKEYWDTATRVHIPFRQNQRLTGTPAFASINNHLGVDPRSLADGHMLTRFPSMKISSQTSKISPTASILTRHWHLTVSSSRIFWTSLILRGCATQSQCSDILPTYQRKQVASTLLYHIAVICLLQTALRSQTGSTVASLVHQNKLSIG